MTQTTDDSPEAIAAGMTASELCLALETAIEWKRSTRWFSANRRCANTMYHVVLHEMEIRNPRT